MRSLMIGALFACAVPAGVAVAAEAPHWEYSGEHGPAHWAAIAPEFAACGGRDQSPIDLRAMIEADLPPIRFDYRAGGSSVTNNGHSMQVDYGPGSTIVVDGIVFALKQFHFHAPSENRIDGRSFPMEGHLVHADGNGNLAVIALMFELGPDNPALDALWPSLPETAGDKASLAAPFEAERLLPPDRDYYRFSGSLTTPPCTEGVRWLVLKSPVPVSGEQVDRFTALMHHPNNRPVQPVNARPVLQ